MQQQEEPLDEKDVRNATMTDSITPYSVLRSNARGLAEALPLRMPYALYIETTNRCNFKCTMCPLSFPDWEETVGGIVTMPVEVHQRIIDNLLELGQGMKLRALKLYSEGEPFIDPNLIEKIRISRPVADRIEITSNGSAITEQKARALLNSGLDYLRISIYSVLEDRHPQITGSKISPAHIRANIERFRRLRDEAGLSRPFLYVKTIDTCTEENEEFLRIYTPIADEVVIEPPMNWNSFENRDLIGSLYRSDAVDPGQVHQWMGTPRKACAFPFYSLVIKANGDVVACCVDWNKKTKVGNVYQNSFSDIWVGEQLREFRRMQLEGRRHENESCRNCTYLTTIPDNLDDLPPESFDSVLGGRRESPAASANPLAILS